MPVTPATTFEISHKGDVRTPQLETAIEKIRVVADRCREDVRTIEVRLMLESKRARERPAMAEATIDVDGRPVRAHEAATTVTEAVDLLVDRLRRRIERHEERRHRLPERRRARDSSSWHHGDPPTIRQDYLDIPFDEREVRRHKTLAMEPMHIEEAVFDLDQLGHSFYLFVDEASGADAVVSWDDDHIALQASGELPLPDIERQHLDGVVVSSSSPPTLELLDAKEHLEASGEDRLFHLSPSSGRGQVLYRRYDGHYGLVIAT